MELCHNGRIKETYIHPNNKSGDMQGLEVNAEYLYAYTDAKGYRININKINKWGFAKWKQINY